MPVFGISLFKSFHPVFQLLFSIKNDTIWNPHDTGTFHVFSPPNPLSSPTLVLAMNSWSDREMKKNNGINQVKYLILPPTQVVVSWLVIGPPAMTSSSPARKSAFGVLWTGNISYRLHLIFPHPVLVACFSILFVAIFRSREIMFQKFSISVGCGRIFFHFTLYLLFDVIC